MELKSAQKNVHCCTKKCARLCGFTVLDDYSGGKIWMQTISKEKKWRFGFYS